MKLLLFIYLFTFNINDGCSQESFRTFRDISKYDNKNIDVKIFRSLNNIKSPFLSSLIEVTNESLLPISVVFPIWLYIPARANNNHYDESSSILLAISEGLNLAATQGAKYLFKRDRPFRTLNNVRLYDTMSVAGTYSFPSGHASGSFAIATLMTLRYPDKPLLITGLYTYASIVSLGRIFWGVHYPSDVLGGMLIGAGSAALIYSLRKPIIETKNELFNQRDRTDRASGNINSSALLLSVIASDVVNNLLSNSDNKIMKKSRVSISVTEKANYLDYNFSF